MKITPKRLPWQKILINDNSSAVIAATGGLRSSKTHGAVLKHINLCFINRDCIFSAFIEPTYGLIKRVAIPLFRKVLIEMGFQEGLHFSMTNSAPYPICYLHFSGQEIHFLTGSKPDMIVGSEYSHATVDEADEQPIETFRNIRSRLSDANAKVRQLVLVGAPQGIKWFAEQFDSETMEGWNLESTRNWYNPKRNFRRLRLITDQNPYLPEGYIEEMEDTYGHSLNLIKAYRYGIFVPLYEGTAYSSFREELHVSKNKAVEPDPKYPVYLTWDFNAYPLVWIAVQIRPWYRGVGKVKKRYTIVAEAKEGHNNMDDAIFDFVTQFPRKDGWGDTRIHIYGDRSGYQSSPRHRENDFEHITRNLRGFYNQVYMEASKRVAPEVDSVESVNRLFAGNNIVVSPKVTGLIRSWQSTCWQKGIRKLHKPAGEVHTHRSDAFKYLTYQLQVIDTLNSEKRQYGINW
jgi:hypothetical protein